MTFERHIDPLKSMRIGMEAFYERQKVFYEEYKILMIFRKDLIREHISSDIKIIQMHHIRLIGQIRKANYVILVIDDNFKFIESRNLLPCSEGIHSISKLNKVYESIKKLDR